MFYGLRLNLNKELDFKFRLRKYRIINKKKFNIMSKVVGIITLVSVIIIFILSIILIPNQKYRTIIKEILALKNLRFLKE
tara:strand:+ start:150 stop:389 length:240 start_codon:yes stop_codon:yes gene_type:complete